MATERQKTIEKACFFEIECSVGTCRHAGFSRFFGFLLENSWGRDS